MIKIVKILRGNQKGLTLLETVVGLAIAAVIIGAFSSSIFGTLIHTASSNAHVIAASGMESALRQISNDGQMAQSASLITPSHIKLSRTYPPDGGNSYDVEYFLSGDELQRQETINGVLQGTKTIISDVTNIIFSQPENNTFSVNMTSSGGSSRVSEGREFHVTLRATTD